MKKIIVVLLIIFSLFALTACKDDNEPIDTIDPTVVPTVEPTIDPTVDPTVVPTEPVINLYEVNPHNDVYYQVFVRSFADSNGDGVGDLNGLIDNLDYIESLGATALWLLPINPSPAYHGYSVTDYYDIDSEYGTLTDFQNLIDAAAEKNIKIVIDLVINHTSDQHPWFVSARSSVSSPYRNYYIWINNNAYESFVGGMKDLNFNNEAVIQEVKDIMDFYLEMGVHGFRIDAAKHLLEGNSALFDNAILMNTFKRHIKTNYPNSFIVSEVFEYAYQVLSDYFIGADSVFNFYAAANIWDKVGNGNSRSLFVSNLEKAYNSYRIINPDFVDSPFIGNHDLDRIASMTGFNSYNSNEKLRLATTVLLTLPGSPFIYYGDEIGMKGVRYEGSNIPGYGIVYDEYRRQPLKWGNLDIETTWLPSDGSNNATASIAVQSLDQNSMLNFYKQIISIRKDNPALMFGNYFEGFKGNNSNLQGYVRYYTYENISQAVVVIHNLSPNTQSLTLDYTKLIYGNLELPAFGSVIIEIDPTRIGEYI
jgi:glycosidase